MRAIRGQTDCELEMFVHGALCVSYSGQCFSSEAWGGRSANRGQCAQACRLPYELIVDGELKPLGDARYLLSPGDLYALQQMPEIVEHRRLGAQDRGALQGCRLCGADHSGLSPGRRRGVGRTAAQHRAGRGTAAGAGLFARSGPPFRQPAPTTRPWSMARSPRHRGVLMGRVTHVLATDSVWIAPEAANDDRAAQARRRRRLRCSRLAQPAGAGRGRPHLPRRRRSATAQLELDFGNGAIDFAPHPRRRPALAHATTRNWTRSRGPTPRRRRRCTSSRCTSRVTAHEGEPLVLHWTLAEQPDDRTVTVRSDEPLVSARSSAAADAAYLRASSWAAWATRPTSWPSLTAGHRGQSLCAQLAAQPTAPPGRRAARGTAEPRRQPVTDRTPPADVLRDGQTAGRRVATGRSLS